MSCNSSPSTVASGAIQPAAGGVLSAHTFQELGSEFKQRTAPMLKCRGCSRMTTQLAVCCRKKDNQVSSVGDKSSLSHSLCLDCFAQRPSMPHELPPGSRDECRFCMEDKNSGVMPRSAPTGEPIKTPRLNADFNALAPIVAAHNAGFEKLLAASGEGGEVSQGQAAREAVREAGGTRAMLEAEAQLGYPGSVDQGQVSYEEWQQWRLEQRSSADAAIQEAAEKATRDTELRMKADAEKAAKNLRSAWDKVLQFLRKVRWTWY